MKEVWQKTTFCDYVSDLFVVLYLPIHETLTQTGKWNLNAFPSLYDGNDIFTQTIPLMNLQPSIRIHLCSILFYKI